MALRAVCRLGDTVAGNCSAHKNIQNWTGVIDTVDMTVPFTVNGVQIATNTATGLASCGHRFIVSITSSITTGPNSKQLARVGDSVTMIAPGNGVGQLLTGSSLFTSE